MTDEALPKKDDYVIKSPNNWLRKAGAYVTNGKLKLPHEFLLVPMTSASEAIVEYNNSNNLNDKVRHAMAIALAVRNADTAFFEAVADLMNNKAPNLPNICQYCIRGHLFGTRMKELRSQVNKKIIHAIDNNLMINPADIELAIEYYEEMFKLPLIDPIYFQGKKGMPLCPKCKKKWGYK